MSIPTKMNAVTAPNPGGPDALVLGEHATPTPGAGEILVKVHAAGVNRPDVMQRSGNYPPPPGAGDILGLEIAGEVVARGDGADDFDLGAEVCALVPGGGYAEYCVVHQSNALPAPAALSMEEAAALPETFFTVWTNVFDLGRLQAGEWLLVHGGSSGIGTTAIQLGKAFGANVIVTAGSDEKCRACEALGATRAINYKTEDFVAVAKEVAPDGINLTLDMIGGDYVEKNWIVAAVEGRIVQIATQHGAAKEVNFWRLMRKRLTHTGSTLRPRDKAFKAAIASNLRTHVWPLIEEKRVRPVMDQTFSLSDATAAHERMESSQHIGKIVLRPE